jgi:hypothetical protein
MTPNETIFAWSTAKEQAALLVAEDDQPDHAIAADCRISKATLERWKLHPTFRERVDQIRARLRDELLENGIGHYAQRIRAMNERWLALRDLIDQRATYWADAVNWQGRRSIEPGAATGLLTRVIKPSRYGTIEEWRVDTELLDSLLDLEKQAADEMARLADVQSRADDATVTPSLLDGHPQNMTFDERAAALAELLEHVNLGGD